MNKIYKVIWSKSKNMYVAVSEYAKSHTKSPQSRLIDKTVVAGVLACVISCGAVLPVYAAGTGSYTANNGSADGKQSIAIGTGTKANTDYDVILGRNSTADDINNVIIIGKGSSVSNNPVAFSSSLDGYQIVGSYSGAVLIGNDASVSLENSTGRFMLGDSYGTSANGTDMTVVVPEDYSKISHVVGIGDNVKIGDMDTVAVGFGARATSKSATAVGHGANAKGENSVALGTSANSTSVLSSALGWGSFATGMGSTALGTNSGTKGSYDIALGFDADISSTKGSNTAIGFNTSVKNNATNAIAVGTLANVTENNGIAIGRYANSQASNGIALGQRSLAKASSSVAIGANSVAVNDDVVSFGHGAYDPRISESLIQYNLMRDGEELGLMKTEISMSDQITNNPQEYKRRLIHVADGINDSDVATVGQLTHFVGVNVPNDEDNGIFASSQGNYAGEGAVGLNSVAIGVNTVVNPDNSIAIGNNNNVSNVKNSVVLGNDNTVSNSYEDYEIAGNYSDVVLIGNKVVADRGYGVPRYSSDNAGYGIDETNHIITLPGEEPKIGRVVGIGDNVKIGDEYSVAIGSNTSAKGLSSLAIGHGANGNDVASVALGTMVNASEFSSAIGFGANATGLNSVAISNASTKGEYDLAAGFGTTITSSKGKNIAIGFNNAVSGTAVNSITMGTNASVSKENAVSIGSYSSSVGEKAVSIGYDATTKGTNSVAIGSGSVAQEDNVVSFGRAITDETPFHDDIEYSTVMGDDGSFQVMGLHMGFDDTRPTELKRRLINVADGLTASDVATVGQIRTVSAGNGLEIAETDNTNGSKNEAFSIKAGTNVTVDENGVNVIGDGTVASGNTGLVTGGNLYSEGRLTSNGNYAKKGKSIAQNITLLDAQLKATDSSAIKDLSIEGNTITFTKGDGTTGTLTGSFTGSSNGDISYDTNNPDTITFNGTKGTKLTNLKQGTLSATSTDAVTGAQLYATNQNIVGFSSDISRNKNNIRELNSSISNTLEMVSSTNGLIDNLSNMKADSSLNNLTSAGRQVIQNMANSAVQNYLRQNGFVANPVAPTAYNANTLTVNDAGNGSLYVGEGSNVNGSSSIAIGVGNQVNANNSGAFGDPSIINADASYVLGNDDTINTGATGSFVVGNDSVSSAKGGLTFGSNNVLEDTAENSIALGNNVTVSGMNSVALGSGSTATEDNIISVGNDTVKRRITNVADGNIADGSTDVITGSQLFATNERVKANEDAIAQKANVDASNINVDDWTAKLGTGTVSEGNTGLVTGGNVFTAIQTASSNNLIQSIDDVINIGGNIGGSTINVANKDGEGRVITGVITNPNDQTSAANVGYVDAVNTNLANAVNQSFYNMNDKMNKLGANAAAMASLTPATFEGDEKWSLSAGVGHYHGETAGAVGAFYRPAENVMMNVRGSFGNDENMLGAAVSVSLSKGDIPGVTKRQLANKVTQLEQVHMQDHALIVQQNQQIAELQAAVREMREQINNK